MDKTIPLTLDVYKPVDPGNCFKIWRGDSVVFNFTFKGNGTDIPLTDADKLRVFAKRIMPGGDVDKDAQPLFAADFTDPITKASFGSTQTAGDAGYYLMTVMLMKGETVVTAQGIKFELLENGYAGIYQPSEDFRDEVVDAKNQAQAAAEAAADSATAAGNSSSAAASSASSADASAQQAAQDKSAVSEMKTSVENTKTQIDNTAQQVAQDRAAAEAAAGTAVNASDLAALCRRAANVGFFEFNIGKLAFDKPGIIAAPPFSLCITYDVDSWAGLGNAPMGGLAFFNNHCVIWTDPYQKGGFHLCYEEAGRLLFACGNLDAAPATREFKATINKPLPVGRHTLVVCVLESLASLGAAAVRCYVDGLYFGDMSLSYNKLSGDDISSTFPFQINTIANYATSTVASCPIDTRLSRVKIFNFDMTAEGAPYTVADYASGADAPLALLTATDGGRCLMCLSDAADSSQIRDESSNGNHAIMSGTVLPSKQNNPAHCSQTITWAGTSTLQNVCGDAAIPANSKVTAYARATGAVTASFKAGAWAAQSKDLAANALTEIGSWLCGAAGAFSVQPSAAYTGSIETYLIIERL